MSATALLHHLTDTPWMDHPAMPRRRRRRSVASLLGIMPNGVRAAADRLAREQARRGVRTIDTATLPGSLGASPVRRFHELLASIHQIPLPHIDPAPAPGCAAWERP